MDAQLQRDLATSDHSEESPFTTATRVHSLGRSLSRNVRIFDSTFAKAFIIKSVMLAV